MLCRFQRGDFVQQQAVLQNKDVMSEMMMAATAVLNLFVNV